MEKTTFYQQIKDFFVRNFDLRQEKEDIKMLLQHLIYLMEWQTPLKQ